MRSVNRALFGDEIMDKTRAVWGLDEEGELRGVHRPSGYPGVRLPVDLLFHSELTLGVQFWVSSGDFVRFQSKQLVSFLPYLLECPC